VGKMPIANRDDLSLACTPGVARPCEVIARDPGKARELTIKRNSVAVVTDGSAVLGLGNIGPYAAIPVMEGKALLFKEFANIDAWPICLDTQDVDEIVKGAIHKFRFKWLRSLRRSSRLGTLHITSRSSASGATLSVNIGGRNIDDRNPKNCNRDDTSNCGRTLHL
jgi:hypothetical protein